MPSFCGSACGQVVGWFRWPPTALAQWSTISFCTVPGDLCTACGDHSVDKLSTAVRQPVWIGCLQKVQKNQTVVTCTRMPAFAGSYRHQRLTVEARLLQACNTRTATRCHPARLLIQLRIPIILL